MMKHTMRRILAAVVSILILSQSVPVFVLAEGNLSNTVQIPQVKGSQSGQTATVPVQMEAREGTGFTATRTGSMLTGRAQENHAPVWDGYVFEDVVYSDQVIDVIALEGEEVWLLPANSLLPVQKASDIPLKARYRGVSGFADVTMEAMGRTRKGRIIQGAIGDQAPDWEGFVFRKAVWNGYEIGRLRIEDDRTVWVEDLQGDSHQVTDTEEIRLEYTPADAATVTLVYGSATEIAGIPFGPVRGENLPVLAGYLYDRTEYQGLTVYALIREDDKILAVTGDGTRLEVDSTENIQVLYAHSILVRMQAVGTEQIREGSMLFGAVSASTAPVWTDRAYQKTVYRRNGEDLEILEIGIQEGVISLLLKNGEQVDQAEGTDIYVLYEPVSVRLAVTPAAPLAQKASLGEQLSFRVMITNTGSEPVQSLTVYCMGGSGEKETVLTLEALESGSAYLSGFTYTVTEADILARGAEIRLWGETSAAVTPVNLIQADTEDVEAVLTLEKTGEDTVKGAGDTVRFTLHVVNNGNVTLKNLVLRDQEWTDTKTRSQLEPGEIWEETSEHLMTESDLGSDYLSVAGAEAVDPEGNTKTASAQFSVKTADSVTGFDLERTIPEPERVFAVGDRVPITTTLTNTGSRTLQSVMFTDGEETETRSVGPLAPGESVTVNTVHQVTEEDLGGSCESTAEAVAQDTDGGEVTKTVSVSIRTEDSLYLPLVIRSVKTEKQVYQPGETVQFETRIMNQGNRTLYQVTVTDDELDQDSVTEKLEPGRSLTLNSGHTFTENDLSREYVSTATVSAVDGAGQKLTPVQASARVQVVQTAPALEMTCVSRENADKTYKAGEKAVWDVTLRNAGNVTFSRVILKDSLTETLQDLGSLAPGEEKKTTVEITVTREMAGRETAFTLEAEAVTQGQESVRRDTKLSFLSASIVRNLKLSALVDQAVAAAGTELTYTVQIRNEGEETENNLILENSLEGMTLQANGAAAQAGEQTLIPSLGAGQTLTLIYSRAVSDGDIGRDIAEWKHGRIHTEGCHHPDGHHSEHRHGGTEERETRGQ